MHDEGNGKGRELAVGEAVAFGWRGVVANLGLWIPAALTAALVGVIPDWLGARLRDDGSVFAGSLVMALGYLLSFLVTLGMIGLALRTVDGEKPPFGDLFAQGDILFRYVVASVIFAAALLVGLALFVLPGLVVLVFFYFYAYVLVDERAGILECLRRSADVTEGARLKLLALLGLLLAVNLLGALAFVVGVLISVPLTFLASAHAYRQLQGGGPEPAVRAASST